MPKIIVPKVGLCTSPLTISGPTLEVLVRAGTAAALRAAAIDPLKGSITHVRVFIIIIRS